MPTPHSFLIIFVLLFAIQLVYVDAHHQMNPYFQSFALSGQNSLFRSLKQKPTPP